VKQPHEHPIDEAHRLLKIGILLTFFIYLLEFFGGLWTHSLALLSDSWHIFIDLWGLLISFFAIHVAQRPTNDRRTFGLHRMEVFAATLNGLTVFLIALGILYAAWNRFQQPVEVHARRLMGVAGISLCFNLGAAALFYRQSHQDMNIRGAFVHLMGDALNTLAVFIAAFLIGWTHSPRIDPVVSGLIALIVLWSAGRLLKDSLNTLLEGVPKGIKVPDVEAEIMRVKGVLSVHDLHVWSICSHLNALSGHVLLGADEMPHQNRVLERIGETLKNRFGIAHTTIQVESKGWTNAEHVF